MSPEYNKQQCGLCTEKHAIPEKVLKRRQHRYCVFNIQRRTLLSFFEGIFMVFGS